LSASHVSVSSYVRYYGFSWIPLFATLALLSSQAAYDGIKGATDPPNFLKAYVVVTIFFVCAVSFNSALNIIRSGSSRTAEEAVRWHAVQEAIFIGIMFLWKVASITFVFVGMRNNNNLNYCESTPLTTIN